MKNHKKLAGCFGGGAFKGAFGLGASLALEERGYQFDVLKGISVGTLAALFMSQGKLKQYEEFWDMVAINGAREIYESKYLTIETGINLSLQGGLKLVMPNLGKLILSGFKLRKVIEEKLNTITGLCTMGPTEAKLRATIKEGEFKIPFFCGAVDLVTGQYREFGTHDDYETLIRGVIASASMPILVEPSVIGDGLWVDGGCKNNSPIDDIIDYINADESEDEWVVILVNNNTGNLEPQPRPTFLNSIPRLLDLLLAALYKEDINEFKKLNAIVNKTKGKVNIGYKHFDSIIIEPPQNLGPMLDTSRKTLLWRRQLGYDTAMKAIDEYELKQKVLV